MKICPKCSKQRIEFERKYESGKEIILVEPPYEPTEQYCSCGMFSCDNYDIITTTVSFHTKPNIVKNSGVSED